MRLIQQRKLYFQEGTSDKVYEVDLCEAGEGEFVVNFRYGRRGSNLKDGTKTVFPVGLEEAQQVFNKLVESKIRKGYRDAGGEVPGGVTEPAAEQDLAVPPAGGEIPLPGAPAARRQILDHLDQAVRGRRPARWRLSRVIWRAGEWRLTEALPSLCELVGSGLCNDPMSRYALAWALGRCGHGDPRALEKLQILVAYPDEPATQRIAAEGLRANDPASVAHLEDRLPSRIAAALRGGELGGLRAAVEAELESATPPFDFLHQLYLLSDAYPLAREVVFEIAQTAPMKPPFFKHLRHLFKVAEFRLDADFFGMLSRRFESSRAFYNSSYYGGRVWVPDLRKSLDPATESAKADSHLAYSTRTRRYLRRRVVQTMSRAGEAGDVEVFITLATGVLQAYDDQRDRREPRGESDYFGGDWVTVQYDCFADYYPLNYLLYTNSSRYRLRDNLRWACRENYQPGDPAPAGREEAFPDLWDQAPDALMHLLRVSRCEPVAAFAVKVWRANESRFDGLVDVAFIADLLGRPFELANQLGLDLARARFDPREPNLDLLQAMLACPFAPARELGLEWLGGCKQVLGDHLEFCAALITSRYGDVQLAVRQLLGTARLGEAQLGQLVPLVIDALLGFDGDDAGAPEAARNARETLLIIAGAELEQLRPEVVASLLVHDLEEVQLLGAHVALRFESRAGELSDVVLESMLLSDFASVRELGMRLFGKLPDSALLERQDILASFCISKKPDLRQAAQPIVQRLAGIDAGFGEEIVGRFYPWLLRKEGHEGLHEDLFELLEGSLGDHLQAIPANYGFRMVESRYVAAQKLGLLLIKKFIDLAQQPMRQVAALGGGQLFELRQHIAGFYRENPDHIRANAEDALRVLDNQWKDGREAGFAFFREAFSEDDWNPSLLVSVCDSNRPEVQAFGRELITRFFKNEDGPEYLTKLSQHPSPDLQTFATNYLERFAGGQPERIAGLELYFVTVLSAVNRGRVAKQRVLEFLRGQAIADREIAGVVTRILARQSATIAIGDRAACIRALLSIQEAWPELAQESPLTKHEFATCETGD